MTMKRLQSEPAVYVCDSVILGKHVDDGIMSRKTDELEAVMSGLKEYFLLKETSELNVDTHQKYLGRIPTRVEHGFEVPCAEELIVSIAEVLGLGNSSGVSTPGIKAEGRRKGEEELAPEDVKKFRTACGKLLLVSHERVDLQCSAEGCARGMSKPTAGDTQCLYPRRPDSEIVPMLVPMDSEWASDRIGRMGTSSSQIYLYGAMVSSWGRTQATVALWSAGAESYALGSGVFEALACRSMLAALGDSCDIMLQSGSVAGISSQCRLGLGRMKHIQIKYLFLQELIREKTRRVEKIPTAENPADLSTKHLEKMTFAKHRLNSGVRLGEPAEEEVKVMSTSGSEAARSASAFRPWPAAMLNAMCIDRSES